MKKVIYLLLAAILLISGCSRQPEAEGKYQAGTYVGKGQGNNGEITVEVVFESEKIESVSVTDHQETAGISDPALEQIPHAIVEQQSLAIDTISGATNTSRGILEAVEDCVIQAGGNAEELKTKDDSQIQRSSEELHTEVLVIGGGLSGLSASIAAKEAGAEVILIEKQAALGGSLALAGGGFVVQGTEFEKEAGIEYTQEEAKELWMNWGNLWNVRRSNTAGLYPEEEKVELIVSHLGENIEWLQAHNAQFKNLIPHGTSLSKLMADYPDLSCGGYGIAEALKNSAETQGVTIYTETKGIELILEDGRVIGALAQGKTTDYTIYADSVILASGGFGNNAELMQEYVPEYAGMKCTSAAGNTGDGILMALAAGAALYEEPWVISAAPEAEAEYLAAEPSAKSLPYANTALINQEGKRFIAENSVYSALSDAMVFEEGQEYSLYDSQDEERQAILEKGVGLNAVIKADTLEELAQALKMDETVLKATVEDFNRVVKQESADALGWVSNDSSLTIEVGPFYAVKINPTLMGTMGGVKTDLDAHVLNAENEIIPGLFAAGEMSNRCFYDYTYMGSISLSAYSIMGRIAGENAAK